MYQYPDDVRTKLASGITNSQAEWMKLGEQMSTGKRVTNPSDDPDRRVAGGSIFRRRRRITASTPRRVRLPPKKCRWKKAHQSGDDGDQTVQEKIVRAKTAR